MILIYFKVSKNLDVTPESRNNSFLADTRHKSPPLSEYHSAISMCTMSPASRSASPLLSMRHEAKPLAKAGSRERISREEVQRRLMSQRSPGSPGSDKELRSSLLRDRSVFSIENLGDDSTRRSPALSPADKQQDRLSVLTSQTDFSVETAVVEVAEKRNLGLMALDSAIKEDEGEFGMVQSDSKLQFDFGSKFSLGDLGLSSRDMNERVGAESLDTLALPPPPPRRAASFESNNSGIKVGDVDVDMDMKSALDRLMEDVAGAGAHPDDSMMTDEYDDSFDRSESQDAHDVFPPSRPKVIERALTDPVTLQENEMVGVMSRSVSSASEALPPPVPPKDNIRSREQAILEKRRETRRMEEEQDEMFSPRQKDQRSLGVGRPSRRRSMSTGDAEILSGGAKQRGNALLLGAEPVSERPLSDTIEQELQKLVDAPQKSVSDGKCVHL